MARLWTKQEEKDHFKKLHNLYVVKNLTIGQISKLLQTPEQTIFKRLKRVGIKTTPFLKKFFLDKRQDLTIPIRKTGNLAEFFGIMLGDGHVSHFQVVVTLGTKELEYVSYVQSLIKKIFGSMPKIGIRKTGYRDIYLGSVKLTKWLFGGGLVCDKVKCQVGVPSWIFTKKVFMKRFLRGFFDTDGSIYKLKFGIQIAFTNRSIPLLKSLQEMLKRLGYRPSEISLYRIYLTRIPNVEKFFCEISPRNPKHEKRYGQFIKCVGTQAVNGSRL